MTKHREKNCQVPFCPECLKVIQANTSGMMNVVDQIRQHRGNDLVDEGKEPPLNPSNPPLTIQDFISLYEEYKQSPTYEKQLLESYYKDVRLDTFDGFMNYLKERV